ncbi:hypothetical protein [Streptomyces sp. NPDC005077]|uniref:hypothetical protein n=1 Tax=Streptomyces sp. NPDC005077 TaxID=3154292 RepID=UPI0033B5BDE0
MPTTTAADAGLAPDLLTQDLTEAGFEAADLGSETGRAGVGGHQVGLQGGAADSRASPAGGRRAARRLDAGCQ